MLSRSGKAVRRPMDTLRKDKAFGGYTGLQNTPNETLRRKPIAFSEAGGNSLLSVVYLQGFFCDGAELI